MKTLSPRFIAYPDDFVIIRQEKSKDAAESEEGDGHWVTLDNGAHVFIEDGKITKGPEGFIGKSREEIIGKSAKHIPNDAGLLELFDKYSTHQEREAFRHELGLSQTKMRKLEEDWLARQWMTYTSKHPKYQYAFTEGSYKRRFTIRENLSLAAEAMAELPGWTETGNTGDSTYFKHESGATFRVANHPPSYLRSMTTGGVYPAYSDDPKFEKIQWLYSGQSPESVKRYVSQSANDAISRYEGWLSKIRSGAESEESRESEHPLIKACKSHWGKYP